jgi:hypothetical protein
MVDRHQLLTDLKPLVRALEADLRTRCDEVVEIDAGLKREYADARSADRVGVTFEEWRADLITQVAVAWVLSCVFVRFLEDNTLVSPPRISGLAQNAGDDQGLKRARDEHEAFFRSHPAQTDRDYLLAVFDDLAKLSGAKDVFGPHNPVSSYRNWLSGDAAQTLIEFFQKIDTDGTGEIIHDFTDDQWDTRFLGDFYQDLSEAARKKYALLQTPVFVEEFILARTLEPAINEFGLKDLKIIDPACGSGHFLLGSFARILNHWRKSEPGTNDRELVNRAMASVHGVDLNPYAVAISRFRLLLAAMKEFQITRLKDAPNFHFNLVCGDSLLHGAAEQQVMGFHELAHHYQSEDIDELRRILSPGQYHAVVANPPYITVKDRALNQAYRARYPEVCHMKYSLAVPFVQRIFGLACEGGFTGQITANSFMKREFGKKLVEDYLPRFDLTHVVDTAGAYIPGHGTPTVILYGRNRFPVAPTVRTVMGIKGEPRTPSDPEKGMVWAAIVGQVDRPGSESIFVSVSDVPREQFAKHPWSIGGGGAAELKAQLDNVGSSKLDASVVSIGPPSFAGIDEMFFAPPESLRRTGVPVELIRPLCSGEQVRDWELINGESAFVPYDCDQTLVTFDARSKWAKREWRCRTCSEGMVSFARQTRKELGEIWWSWYRWIPDRYRTRLSIVFGEVATHNHFALVRGGKVFKQTAPVIKLTSTATEDEHLALLGLLNSSTACFWLRQVCQPKGSSGIGRGVYDEAWEKHFAYNSTNLERFPIPTERPLSVAKGIDSLIREFSDALPTTIIAKAVPEAAPLAEARRLAHRLFGQIIAMQEELDWLCYGLYGLIPMDQIPPLRCDNPPALNLGQRAFEIVLARKVEAGNEETTWFARHDSSPITEFPDEWSDEYKQIVQRRIDLIASDRNIGLIERPEFKRRWNAEPWEQRQKKAFTNWLLNRLESYFDLDGRMNDEEVVTAHPSLREPGLTNVAKIADVAKQDKDFIQVAEIYVGRMDFDVANLVSELIAAESVPGLPVLRYKPSGLDKRAAWERTWDLQRLEDGVDAIFENERVRQIETDNLEPVLRSFVAALQIDEEIKPRVLAEAIDAVVRWKMNLVSATDAAKRVKQKAVGEFPVPPEYTSADFRSNIFWHLRGKLDVPKERWVSFPYCESEDGTLVIAWAGYDHLQLARAIAERYEHAKEFEGRKPVPLLACIGHLIPWLKQWHNELDPTFGARLGDYFESYVAEEAKALGMSMERVMAWTPPQRVSKLGRKKT